MNFNVNSDYKKAAEQFWSDPVSQDASSLPNDLDVLVSEISNKIIGASNLRPVLEKMAGTPLSIVHSCYLIVQDLDRKNGTSAQSQIEQASLETKILANHIFKKLSITFTQITPQDLQEITILFGIKQLSDLAKNNTILKPELSSIEKT